MIPDFWGSIGSWSRVPTHGTSVLVTAPVLEPLTLTEAKLRAELEWTTDAARDALMTGFIVAARAKVEHDTGLALLTQTRDVFFDRLPNYSAFELPSQSRPLQSVTTIKTIDTAGATNTLNATNYIVDTASGRIALSPTGVWPTDLRAFQPWVIRIVSGWTAVNLIPPSLVQAVGILVAHYATHGRDVVTPETLTDVPYGYDECIAPHRLFSAA